jgi:hypothetical protein
MGLFVSDWVLLTRVKMKERALFLKKRVEGT